VSVVAGETDSTIIQPPAQMAAMATRTVLALIDGKMDTSNSRVELTTSLVIRSSTAPPSTSL
jgi:LacI family transcriptional regulator, xylobiose transport system transcriptional regulator